MDRLLHEFAPGGAWVAGCISVACLACLAIAYWIRSRADRAFDQVRDEVFALSIRGRNPKRCVTLREQYQKIECERQSVEITIKFVAWIFLCFGFVAPLLLLFLMISLDNFLFAPGHRIFQTMPNQSMPTDIIDRALFVIDEAGHVLTDAISDSFHWSITGLRRNENNLTFSLYLALLFRLVCGGFVVSALTLIWRASVSLRPQKIAYLEMLKGRAEKAGACDLTEGMRCDITTKSTLVRLREFLFSAPKIKA